MSVSLKQPQEESTVAGLSALAARLDLRLVLSVLLAALAIACYWGIGRNQFVNYDDQIYITANQNLNRGFSSTGIAWCFSTSTAHNWHPITWLSHTLDVSLFGRRPQWHHRENVLFHAANTVLLFLLLTRLTGRPWPSAFVAALFAAHPLNVETVAWAAERKSLLSTLFLLLTIWAYARYCQRRSMLRYLVVTGFFALGLMSKPMLVTLPFVLLLLDYWPLARIEPLARSEAPSLSVYWARWKPLVIEKLPLLVFSLLDSWVTYAVQEAAQSSLSALPLGQRLANALTAYVGYLVKFLFPFQLSVLYPHPRGGIPLWQSALALVVLLAITAAVLKFGKMRKYLPVGWFWYLGTLVPVIGLVQVGTHAMADRYTYVPLIGIFIIVAWGVADLSVSWSRRVPVLASAAGAAIICLWVLSFMQVRVWENTGTLFQNALRINSENDVAQFHVANDLLSKGKLPEAIVHYREALRLAPGDEEFALGLAHALYLDRNYDEAIKLLDQIIKADPGSLYALNQRGMALLEKKDYPLALADFEAVLDGPNIKDNLRIKSTALLNMGVVYVRQNKPDAALERFEQSLLYNPANAEAHLRAARIEYNRQQYDKALEHLQHAIRYQPRDIDALYLMAQTFVQKKMEKQAIALLREMVVFQPNNPRAHFALAQLLIDQHQTTEAVAEMDKTAQLLAGEKTPDWARVANDLAWYLATTSNRAARNADRAVQLAEQVCHMTAHSDPGYLDTLAAAYACAGKYDQAVKTADKAYNLAIRGNEIGLGAQIKSRQRLYEAGEPYRDPLH